MTAISNWKKNVGLFITGQALTLFGSMLVHYAVMWHITLKTQSGLMMTFIAAAGALPMFLISPFGGVWADRYNKKFLINLADGIIAAITLIMAVVLSFGFDSAWLLLICLIMRAFGQGVQMPAVNALIPELVPKDELTRINGISASVQSAVMFASPMVGAALLAVAPIHMLMYIDVITAALGIGILVLFVKTPASLHKEKAKAGAGEYFHEIGEGIRYVKGQAFLKKFLLLSALFNIMVAPAAILTPLQVARDWGADIWMLFGNMPFGPEQRLAAIEVVFFIGMMLGGAAIGVWGGFKNKSHTMALSTFLLGIGSVGLGLLTNFWVYLGCMAFIGLVLNLFNAPMMATLQVNVDPDYMGRVFSVLAMMSSLMMPLGMVLWGPLGDVVAIDYLLIGTGIAVFLMGFAFLLDKSLLKAGEPVKSAEENGEVDNTP